MKARPISAELQDCSDTGRRLLKSPCLDYRIRECLSNCVMVIDAAVHMQSRIEAGTLSAIETDPNRPKLHD
jgi:excinuclease UvrABC nuclease subunit